MSDQKGNLKVNRTQFLKALRQLKRFKADLIQPAVLTFGEDQLTLSLGGCSFRFDATGHWQGEVHVPAASFKRIFENPLSAGGPLSIVFTASELCLDAVAMPCTWNALIYPRIELPLGAPLLDQLALRLSYSIEDIRRSGLEGTLSAAEAKRDKLLLSAVIEAVIARLGSVHQ